MANQITLYGIEIATVTEIVNNIINGTPNVVGLKGIYGQDINIDQDSPDAQNVNIYAQAARDALELAVNVFNSFDPDQASGDTLDARVIYNGVQRKSGEPTQITVNLTFTAGATIYGINDDETGSRENVYTIADDNGNIFYLLNTRTESQAGVYSCLFVSALIGDIYVKPDLEMAIVNPVRYVTRAVYANSKVAGFEQETDEALRIRRAKAVGVGMLGSVEVLQSSLRQLPLVKEAVVFENHTAYTDADGIPPHSVWVIVRGGTDEVVASCIYLRLNAGCGMKGSTTVYVKTIDNSYFPIVFDRAVEENVSVKFTVTAENFTDPFNEDLLIEHAIANYQLSIWQPVTSTDLDRVLDSYSSNYVYTNIQFSTDPNTRAYEYTIDLTDNIENFLEVTNGALTITVNGGDAVDITGLNFGQMPHDTETTLGEQITYIAGVLNNAFENLGIKATADIYDANKLKIEAQKRGSTGSIVVAQTATQEIDISESSYLNLANATYQAGHDATYSSATSRSITDVTAFQTITDGKLLVNDDNDGYQLKNMNFSQCQNLIDVAAVISMAAYTESCPFTATVNGVNIEFISNIAGSSINLTVANSPSGVEGTELLTSTLLGTTSQFTYTSGTASTNGYCKTPAITVSNFNAVSHGALSIQVNSDAFVTATDLDFSDCNTIDAIANVIAQGISTARCSVRVEDDSIVFYSNVAGLNSAIHYQTAPITYTQLCSGSYLGAVADWNSVAGLSPVDWYTILYPSSKKNVFVLDKSYFSVTDGNS